MPLVIDGRLLAAWRSSGLDERDVLGLAGSVSGRRGAVVAVTTDDLDDRSRQAAAGALALVLGVDSLELVTSACPSRVTVEPADVESADVEPAEVIRSWIHQAAQGSGRGVHVVGVDPDADIQGHGLLIRISSIDSSARELALRLASPQDPALAALSHVLGMLRIRVTEGGSD